MFKFLKANPTLIRNCLIVYTLTGLLSHIFAQSHHSFKQSTQSSNAYKFSRVISISLAYHAKESFDND